MTDFIQGFRHIGIIVSSMDASLKFYRDILGLEVIQDFTDDSDYINQITNISGGVAHFVKLKMNDGTVLELLEYPTHPTTPHNLSILNVGVCHLALRVSCADQAYQCLRKNKIEVLSEPVLSSEGIAKVFFCLDPDGIRVEMVEMVA